MKYQDFSSDENLVSCEDTWFLSFTMWRYHGCHDNFILAKEIVLLVFQDKNITILLVDTNLIFSSSISTWTLKDKNCIHMWACNILYVYNIFNLYYRIIMIKSSLWHFSETEYLLMKMEATLKDTAIRKGQEMEEIQNKVAFSQNKV